MFGRLGGLIIGLVVLATGFGLWKPQVAARYEHVVDFGRLPLADFGQYRALVSILIMAVGLAIALAALQREPSRKSNRPVVTVLSDDEEPAQGQPVFAEGPAYAEGPVYAEGPAFAEDQAQADAHAHQPEHEPAH